MLSANVEAPISCESLIEDMDLAHLLKREEFESIV